MDATLALHLLHKRQRDIAAALRYAPDRCDEACPDPRRLLARAVERDVAWHIADLGYAVNLTTPGARCDLLVEHTLRVEVKASTWNDRPDRETGGYYQFFYHNRADLLIACCVNGSYHPFVIPVQDLAGRRNIRVHTHDPADYTGQWAPYLGTWSYLDQVLETTRARPIQRSYLQ